MAKDKQIDWEEYKPGKSAPQEEEWPEYVPEKFLGPGGRVPLYLEQNPNIKGLVSGAIESLPVAGGMLGAMGGGLLSGAETVLTGGIAAPLTPSQMAIGAGVWSALGESAKFPLETYILGKQPKELSEYATDVGSAGFLGAAGEGASQAVGKGLLATGKAITGLPAKATKFASRLMGISEEADIAGLKQLDDEMVQQNLVESAGEALDIKPTRGMKTTNITTRGLESSLEQAPTVAGNIVRSEVEPVRKAMSEFVNTATKSRSESSPVVIGESIKGGIRDSILKSYEPIKALYKRFEQSAINIPIKEKSALAIAKNLSTYADEMLTTTDRQMVKEYADNILSAKNVNQLKELRSQVLSKIRSDRTANPEALGLVAKKIDNAIQSNTLRAALEAAKESGTTGAFREGIASQGKEVIKEFRGANAQYRELMQELGKFAEGSKISKKIYGPMDLIERIEDIPSEQLADKLFTSGNSKALNLVKKLFPEQFELVRSQKLSEIYQKTLEKTPMGTEVASPNKFIKAIEEYTPEIREALFGPEFKGKLTHDKAIDAMKTLVTSFPSKMGPSGTPQGLSFLNILSPQQQLEDALRLYQYRGGGAPSAINLKPPPAPGLLNRATMRGAGQQGLNYYNDKTK